MAQNPVVCGVSVLVCRTRVTLLDDDGSVAAGPNNSYVTDNPIRVTVTPVIEAGKDTTLKGGCDCIIASYKGPDLLKRFDLEFDIATIEPAMLSLMLGATLISDTSDTPVPIGVSVARPGGLRSRLAAGRSRSSSGRRCGTGRTRTRRGRTSITCTRTRSGRSGPDVRGRLRAAEAHGVCTREQLVGPRALRRPARPDRPSTRPAGSSTRRRAPGGGLRLRIVAVSS